MPASLMPAMMSSASVWPERIRRTVLGQWLRTLRRNSTPEVRRALALGDGPLLGADLLSARVRHPAAIVVPVAGTDDAESGLLRHQLERVEAQLIRETMARYKGNKTHVAQELGLTRVGLRMKLMRLGLDKEHTPF